MTRPKFFRDPVHLQIRFENVDLTSTPPPADSGKRNSWLLRKLIDTKEFQRLRFIRQTGLTNLVFHGAEHSRFAHSLGVCHIAHLMYDSVVRNMGEEEAADVRLEVGAAALLHDIGHGPFSHTLEQILKKLDVPFDHEVMTKRIITEADSSVFRLLKSVDADFPNRILMFIDKPSRNEDKWQYKLVSSQLDADRLDYLLRDTQYTGVRGCTFDLDRILDLLHHVDHKFIAVEQGGMEAVESYILALDRMYRAVYYHHAIRSANFVLESCVSRAVELHRKSDFNEKVFPDFRGEEHPLALLARDGHDIELKVYLRLGEHHIWALIEYWLESSDPILRDLAQRSYHRILFKSKEFNPMDFTSSSRLKARAEELVLNTIEGITEETVHYYVGVDEPTRLSYKRYDFKPEEGATESIWITGDNRSSRPIEQEEEAKFLPALMKIYHPHRLIFPEEIRNELLKGD